MGAHLIQAGRVLESVRRVVQSIRTGSAELERKTGLTGAQVFVLTKLAEDQGVTVNAIARRTFTHQSSVSVVVRKLQEKGLVRRQPGRKDRRCVELWLTAAGQEAAAHAEGGQTPADRVLEAVLRLPPRRQKALADALEELTAAMDTHEDVAGMFLEEGKNPSRASVLR